MKKKLLNKMITMLLSLALTAVVVNVGNVAGADDYSSVEAELSEVGSAVFGTAGTALTPGIYSLPVSMKNASNISNDSMAAGCIAGAKLMVSETGKASVAVDLQPVTAFGLTIAASDWSIYQTEMITAGQNKKAQFTTDDTGAVNQITFDVPDNSWDGVYVNMFIDAPMNVYQDAYFLMDYANAALLDEPENKGFLYGAAQTELSAGTYSVPVRLRNASNHANDSAAVSVFPERAELIIDENGKAEIVASLGKVTMGPISDMAKDIKVYQNDAIDDSKKDAVVLETVMTGDDVVNGPKEVPSKISFEIPDNSYDGVYLSFWVDAMGYAPDAWLEIDYANAVLPGQPVVYAGKARVTQFGKYDVNVNVTVADGVIKGIQVEGSGFSGTYAEFNKTKLSEAAEGLKNAWNGMKASQDNAEQIYNVDAVSSATISSNAIRDGVLDALSLTYENEVINVPEKVEPGIYEVEIAYTTDIVEHSLTGGEKQAAKLTADNEGNLTLEVDVINGTAKEPLYVLGYNGYYADNDRSKELLTEHSSTVMGTMEFSDTYFAQGTPVVEKITTPLTGSLDKIYNTNVRLYVPAMNNLNGNVSGVEFENGIFNVDGFIKVYWDSMKRTGDYITEPDIDIYQDGKYTVDIALWHETQDQPSMGNAAFAENPKAVITTVDGAPTIQIRTNPVVIGTIKSALENMRFENNDGQIQYVSPVEKLSITASDGSAEHELEYISKLEFKLPSTDDGFIPVYIKVPYTPMGDDYIAARLKLDLNTLAVYDDTVTIDSAVNDGKDIKVQVTNNGEKRTADAVIARYDENGRLLGCLLRKADLSNGTSEIVFDGVGADSVVSSKVFLLNSIESHEPLAGVLNISEEG